MVRKESRSGKGGGVFKVVHENQDTIQAFQLSEKVMHAQRAVTIKPFQLSDND